jgi:hypothetical protein
MANSILITDAGLAEVVNAEQSGTAPVVIASVGYGTGQYTPDGSQTALKAEFKRLTTIAGGAVGANVIHLTAQDDSFDDYTVYEVGIYTESGTLFAVCSQTTPILEKASKSQSLIAIDIAVSDFSAASVTFGDTNFTNPPATTERQGIVELATDAETVAGTDASRVVTPKTLHALKATVDRAGLVELATEAEVEAGVDKERAVTPGSLAKVLGAHEKAAATADKLGHVKIGKNVDVAADGTISVNLSKDVGAARDRAPEKPDYGLSK